MTIKWHKYSQNRKKWFHQGFDTKIRHTIITVKMHKKAFLMIYKGEEKWSASRKSSLDCGTILWQFSSGKTRSRCKHFFFHSESIFMKYANKLMERTCTAFIITNYPWKCAQTQLLGTFSWGNRGTKVDRNKNGQKNWNSTPINGHRIQKMLKSRR